MEVKLFDKEKDTNLRQSNFLIEARYKLTLHEFRIITVIMSMVSQNDQDFKEYRIDLGDVKKLIQDINKLKTKNESIIIELKKATKGLLSKPLIIITGNEAIQMNWISSAKYEKGKSYVSIKLDPELKPYLLKIRSNYTDFELQELLSLKSFYSAKIYELMKQFFPNIPKRKFKIEELQQILGCNYPKYGNFKERVLKSAIMEINNKTALTIDFEEKKEGKKITDIVFNIRGKNDFRQLPAENDNQEKKDKKARKDEGNEKKEDKEKQDNKLETLDEARKYFSDKGFKSNPEKFFNFYEAKEWKGIKKRSATADNWELNFKERNPDLYKITLNSANSDSTVALNEPISINNNDPLWLKLSNLLNNDFDKEVFDKWLSKLNFVHEKDGIITLATETKFLRDWIKREYSNSILSSFQKLQENLKAVKIVNIELQIN